MSEPVVEVGAQLRIKPPRELQDAVAHRKLAEQVLSIKGSYAPSLATMKEEMSVSETSTVVKGRIEEVKSRHIADMQVLHDMQAEDYLAERVDAYLSKDDGINLEEVNSYYLQMSHRGAASRNEAADATSSFRYMHLKTLLALERRQMVLALEEEQARRKRDAQFPGSIAEWRAIKDKDIQARIGLFLMAGRDTKDKMIEKFGWAYRQVKPLEDEYAKNTVFQHTVRTSQDSQR
ncbi:hypothetical protein BDY19DRAFT_996486 [Irpex rosettiformis]|uniref:Uncharacterized protein n=1 Tax=Irpex rosettiformis TaxID=378272 RepID=A0ACB8TVJ5_9APHY|nr:hypothetical protein BDY19DRAFT_996486 [Irpex rosettiformis]